MNRPTPAQVTKEIATLTKLKPKVKRFTAFGDDNHAAIDVQLRVLEKRMSEDDIYNYCGSPDDDDNPDFKQSELDAALDARRYLDGEYEDGTLSKSWKELAK